MYNQDRNTVKFNIYVMGFSSQLYTADVGLLCTAFIIIIAHFQHSDSAAPGMAASVSESAVNYLND